MHKSACGGVPAGLVLMCMNICDFVRNYYFNIFGGQVELAAWGVVQKIGNAFMQICVGIAQGIRPVVSYLRTWIFCIIGFGFIELFNAAFQSIGRWKISMANTIVNKVLLLTPIMILLANLFGIDGIVISQPITENLTAIVLFAIYLIVVKQEKRCRESAAFHVERNGSKL